MKKFSGNAIIEHVSPMMYKLHHDLSYENDIIKVTCKANLKTDGFSAPKITWSFMGSPFFGKHVEAAIIHDGLYRTHSLSQFRADKLFIEMLKVSGVGVVKRSLTYLSLRLFGSFKYNRLSPDIKKSSVCVRVKY